MASENKCPHCGKPVPATALGGICPECMLKAGLTETGEVGPGGTLVAKPSAQPAPRVDEIAPHFPQLEILECLGRGGMGAVYKARQPRLDRLVALKILTRKRDSSISDTEFAARFQQEARALARLNHPDIVAVYDFGEAGGFHYLLMEFVDGLTLRQLLQTKRISPEEALAIVPKICEALQFAHERGIVHRDIKPENILLDKQGRIKIADFGIAKILGTDAASGNLTGAKDVIGTPHYMAPEQIEKPTKVDHRADIYSLGVVFYEMLTGELPLGNFQPPSRKVQVDVRLDEVVLHALEKEPDRRYQHASQVKTDVERIATSPRQADPSAAAAATSTAPRVSPCHVSTPEHLRTFRGRFLSLFQGTGELCLDGETLSFRSGWQSTAIPLSSIQSLAQGWYPRSAKPVPIHYIAVTFAEHGSERTLLFTPVASTGMLLVEAITFGAEWLLALQAAIRNRTGRLLSIGQLDAAKDSFWPAMAKSFLLSLVTTTTIFALLPVMLERRLPNRLSEWILGPLTTILTFTSLLVMRWLRRGPFAVPGEKARATSTKWVTVPRWTARLFSVLLLAFYGFFILAEGLPPIASQPEGVQFNFIALGLMLLGFLVGWKREGAAALLIALGWTVWHISEGRMRWNLFQTPLPVAALYAVCWWATRGQRTSVLAGTALALAALLGLGRLFVPTSVFVRGAVVDAQTGAPVPNIEMRLLPRTPRLLEKGDRPSALGDKDGRFTLFVSWYAEAKEVAISAPGYATLRTNLGPRALGERSVDRDFQLKRAIAAATQPAVPPVVIVTLPESGTADVDPALTELRVTFSKPMQNGNWAWCKWGEGNFPEMTGEPRFLEDERTCVLPVRLQPGQVYALWLNSEHHDTFKDQQGRSAVPYLLIFQTRK